MLYDKIETDRDKKGRARILDQRIGRRVGGKNNQHDAISHVGCSQEGF